MKKVFTQTDIMKFKTIFFILIIAALAVMLSANPKIELKTDTSVSVNGKTVINYRCPAFGQSPDMRATLLFMELTKLSEAGRLTGKAEVIQKSETEPFCIVSINGSPITIVTDEDGKQANSTCEGLAEVWADNITEALKLISLYMTEKQGVIPIGESRIKNIYGYGTETPEFTVSNPDICEVTYNETNRTFTVFGKDLGTSQITISDSEETFVYTVSVKKYAAAFPDCIKSEVTGNPAAGSLVENTLRKTIDRNVICEPRASYKVNSIKWTKKSLYPGQRTNASVSITAFGEEYISVTKEITFTVENVNLERGEPVSLLYSNNPETVKANGDLFFGHLTIGKCDRLLYHHMNKTAKTAKLIIEIINPNDESVEIRSRRAAAKPILDTIAIGVVAAKTFINYDDENSSQIETIPPKSRACFLEDTVKNTFSSSGIMQFWQLSGKKECIVRVKMTDSSDNDIKLDKTKSYFGTGDFDYSEYTFLNPKTEIKEEYSVGGPWVFIPIGKYHLENEQGQKLYGNYGVTYNISVKLTNPTDKETKVRVYIDPTAGPMAAYLKINKEYVTIHHVKPPNEYNLAVYSLKPGETKDVNIKTIPVSGSNYPAKIVVGTL
ncbi:MAG: pilus assembly protein N-terminal domain-containing protein [Armatimonadetes bacterium]|nr:pilus assembly protein N-terminal domain-containing protein [Candidatus Hippobium faecium]